MTCAWTGCDGNHARCSALLACLGQVPENGAGTISGWVGGHNMKPRRLSVQGATFGELVNGHDLLALRAWVAERIAGRLLAWLRWPGERRHHVFTTLANFPRTCVNCGMPGDVRDVSDEDHRYCGDIAHPLDGTDVAGLRPCGFFGGPVVPDEWFESWPAVAVVADYLSTCGGWRWVHDWREPVFGKGVAEALLPVQLQTRRGPSALPLPYQAAADRTDHELRIQLMNDRDIAAATRERVEAMPGLPRFEP